MKGKTNRRKTMLEQKIFKYINLIGGNMIEKLKLPNLEFSMKFLYPNPKYGRTFYVMKPKKKNQLQLFTKTILNAEHKEKYCELEDYKKFELIQIIHRIILRNILTTSLQFEKNHGFTIIENIYYEDKEDLNINLFYQTIRRIFSCTMECVMAIQDFFSGTFNLKDYIKNSSIKS
jgi:hypothetical protein